MILRDAIKITGDNYDNLSVHDKGLYDKMKSADEHSYIECVYISVIAEKLLTGTYKPEEHEPSA